MTDYFARPILTTWDDEAQALARRFTLWSVSDYRIRGLDAKGMDDYVELAVRAILGPDGAPEVPTEYISAYPRDYAIMVRRVVRGLRYAGFTVQRFDEDGETIWRAVGYYPGVHDLLRTVANHAYLKSSGRVTEADRIEIVRSWAMAWGSKEAIEIVMTLAPTWQGGLIELLQTPYYVLV